jgi:hypothetical protein
MSDLEVDDHASQLQEGTPTMAGTKASRGTADEDNDGSTQSASL